MYAFLALTRGGFLRNLQYRLAHMLHNLGSAVFGFVYISVWAAAAHGRPVGPYTPTALTHYMAINQVLLFTTLFLTRGLQIGDWVRSGRITLEMQRPMPFFRRVIGEETGLVLYNFVYRSIPLAAVYAIAGDFTFRPLTHPEQDLQMIAALTMAVYTGLCLNYLVGLSAFWLTEIRFAHALLQALAITASGTAIPLSLMPLWAGRVASLLPFASLCSFPDNVYLGMATPSMWFTAIIWTGILGGVCVYLTKRAAARLEAQGG